MGKDASYVVGYDLNDTLSQISYFELNNEEPITLSTDGDDERLGIPTLLCKRRQVNQWSFGNEARKLIDSEGEAEVSKILSLAVDGKSLQIENESFEGIDLLILFIRKSLNMLSAYVDVENIALFVITVPDLSGEMLAVLERVAAALPISRDKIHFQSYSESVYHYMIHQQTELWERETVVFDHDGRDITCYHMKMNKRTTPEVAIVDNYYFDGLLSPDTDTSDEDTAIMDERMENVMHDFLSNKMVRAVYLLGPGFEGDWYKRTIRFLCMGRRVFQGKNMYSKGACFYGKDKIEPYELNENHVFLGKDKLQFNLGMNVRRGGKEEYIAVADGGENWFEAGATVDVLLEEGSSINLLITPLDGKEIREITMDLDGLPARPPKTTRLRLKVSFSSGTMVKLLVRDMGFGEIFKSSDMKWEKEIDIM